MEKNKYLPAGSIISNKYEVIETLGEDEFEILYLVRDIKRKGSFFVLKELFLETFSSREGELVFTVPEALGVFHKRKKQIIEEIEAKKSNLDDIKVYGYEDDNNTVYTIMEFSNNASLEKYLHFTHKDLKSLPTLDELINKKKSFNYAFILKVLLLMGLLAGVALYSYRFFQQSSVDNESYELKEPVNNDFPQLKDRVKRVEVTVEKDIPMEAEESSPNVSRIERIEEPIAVPIVSLPVIEKVTITEVDFNKSNSNNETVAVSFLSDTSVEEELLEKEERLSEESAAISIERRIKLFLDDYITASATSVDETMKFYDTKVKKYFRFNHPTHKTIIKSQKRYNLKWVKREFQISDFTIVKAYQKDDLNYYDLKTTTLWQVDNKRGKKVSGRSRGFMTLKEVEDGFKIISIYAIK